MTSSKYIGLDVHKESISIAVRNAAGKIVMESVIETKASMILDFIDGLRGEIHVTFEEGTWSAWLYDLLRSLTSRDWWFAIRAEMLCCKKAIRMIAWMRGTWPNCCRTTNCARSITQTMA